MSDEHILDDGFVLAITESKGFGRGMSKAQKLAVAPAIVSAIQRTKAKTLKRIDAHAPIADPLTAHVVGVTTVGEKLKDFAKDAGITLSPGVSAMVICADCGDEVARNATTQKRCTSCAKARKKARAKARNSTPEAKARENAYQKARYAAKKKKARVDTKEAMANREGIKK